LAKPTTALVIDDDIYNVDLFCEYLEMINVKVLGRGHNGREAVELYEQYKPDIVFLDLLMPDYDGIYALENIRKIDPNAYVAMVTAVVDSASKERVEKLNPNHIVSKPFEPESIAEIIANIRQGQSSSIEQTKAVKFKKDGTCRYAQQSVFLKSSTFLENLHSLHTCQILVLSTLRGASYPTEYIFPPQAGHGSGMSIFIM
jgi:DNA-binding NarL/FixJ family response regulator